MTKTIAIALREYNAVVRSKAFVISMVLLPVMMFSSFLVQKLGQAVHDVNDRRFAVILLTNSMTGGALWQDLSRYIFEEFAGVRTPELPKAADPAPKAEAASAHAVVCGRLALRIVASFHLDSFDRRRKSDAHDAANH